MVDIDLVECLSPTLGGISYAMENVITCIQTATSKEVAFSHFNKAMVRYGYDSNVYTLITDHPSIGEQSTHGMAASYPQDWITYYNGRKYQLIDPVWSRLREAGAPFFWKDAVDELGRKELSEQQVRAARLVMHEAAEFGVADGIGISFVNPHGEIAAVGLSRTRAETAHRPKDMAEVLLLSAFFHEKFMSFYPTRVKQ